MGASPKARTAFGELRQFLFDKVTSYDDLEVLLLLQRQPGLEWTANTVAKPLGLSVAACEVALENLAAHGVLVLGGNPVTFRYAPASKELAASAELLQRTYRKDHSAIVQLMTTNAIERVRAKALGSLSQVPQLTDARNARSIFHPRRSPR